MILDSLWLFTGGVGGTGNGDGLTDSPTTGTQNSSNVVDIGMLNGLPVSAASGGGGRDLGIGDDPALKLMVLVTVAFAGGTNLQVGVQGAIDSGNNTPGAYNTFATGPVVVEANLIAGVRIFDVDFPRQLENVAPPRYIRLTYISTGTHTAGKIEGLFVLDRNDAPYIASGTYSGYPAGINITN